MDKTFIDQWKLIKKYHIDTRLDDIPITARSIGYYKKAIFPDVPTNKRLISELVGKDFLDVGSGINHEYSRSLLYKLAHAKKANSPKTKALGLDIIDYLPKNDNYVIGSIFASKLKKKQF